MRYPFPRRTRGARGPRGATLDHAHHVDQRSPGNYYMQTLEVPATLTEEDLEERLEDWDQHLTEPEGVPWLRGRLR